ncbi:hypothetical protein ACFE04_002914 [Oxalis oulophora]
MSRENVLRLRNHRPKAHMGKSYKIKKSNMGSMRTCNMWEVEENEGSGYRTNQKTLKDIPKRDANPIGQEEWDDFVKWVTSPEFDIISQKLTKIRNEQRNQARVGRKGMTGCMDEHMGDGDVEPDRVDAWMWARMNVAGEFDDPVAQIIVNKILSLKPKQKAKVVGKFTRGPFYQHEFMPTQMMDGILNEKELSFEEKDFTLFAVIVEIKQIVASGCIVADGAPSNVMVHFKFVTPD